MSDTEQPKGREILQAIQDNLRLPLDATREEVREKLVNLLLVATVLTATLHLVFAIIYSLSGDAAEVRLLNVAAAVVLLGSLLVYVLNRLSSRLAAWTLLVLMVVAVLLSDTPEQTVSGRNLVALAIPVVVASLLLRPYTSLVIAGLGSGAIIIMAWRVDLLPPLSGFAMLFLLGVASTLLAGTLERTVRSMHATNRNLALLNQASRDLSASLDLDKVLNTILDEMRVLMGVVACSIWLIDRDTDSIVCRQATGSRADVVRGWRMRLDEGLVGWAASSGESVNVSDAQKDERYTGIVDRETGLTLRSVLSIPMKVRNEIIGVLQVVDTKLGRFTRSDIELLEPLAATAAIAIENARMYKEEQQRVEALAQALAQQRALDQLKDEFVQNISHELRTPLAIIQGHTELLQSGELGDFRPEQQKSLEVVVRRIHMLGKLVNDLFVIMTIGEQNVKQKTFDLANLVRDMMMDFELTAKRRKLSLIDQVAKDPIFIVGEPEHMRRVLDNLLENAFKFTPEGGSVSVELGRKGNEAVLQISDTGIGISQNKVKYVFERFYQADGSTTRRYGGAGLGLAVVKEIIDAHGGVVTVDSQLEKGSIFRIVLPLAGSKERE